MKKASFTALLYREFYLVRQANLINLLSFTGCAVLGWLMLLSIRYGNFALLFSEHPDSSSSILSNEAIMNMLRLFIIAGIKYFPLLMAGAFALTTADVAAKDSMTNWNRFSHCTPVAPLRFASVRLLVTVASTAASFLLAMGYLISVECGMGEPFSYGDFSILVLMVSCYIVFGVLGQIFVTLLRNKDVGMLCAMGFVMAPVMIISAANSNCIRMKLL